MRLGYLLALGLVVSLCGCGGDGRATTDGGDTDAGGADGGPGDGGPGDGGPGDGGPGDGGDAMDGSVDEDASMGDGGGEDDAGTDDGSVGGDAMTDATITLSDVSVYGNCMPIVASDPVIAFWTVTVSGASSSTATLVDAKLTISGAATTIDQTLTVDEPTVDLTDGEGSQMQRKEEGDGSTEGACGSLCTGATYSLELTYEVDGATVTVTETGDYSCVY